MATNMIALVLTAFLVSGFSWGRTETADSQNNGSSLESTSKSSYNTRNTATAQSPTRSPSPRKAVNDRIANTSYKSSPQSPAPDAAAGAFPTALISSLASGDEEERQARIESLRRLSQAMSKMRAQNAGAETAPVS